MMALDRYPWNERYGWVKDRFGMTWQLMLGKQNSIKPSMLFTQNNFGRGLEAMELYSKVFRMRV